MTNRTFRTIAHSLMVHARVSEAYIHLSLTHTTYHIFPVLPIKYIINEDSDTTTQYKFLTGTKHPVSHLCLLFCRCVLRKATAHVGKKALNMRHEAQNFFCSISVRIPQHQIEDHVYVPSSREIKS